MKNVLEEIAYGNLPINSMSYNRKSEYGKAIERINTLENELSKFLDEDKKALLDELISQQGKLSSIACANHFINGYRFATLSLIEVFNGKSLLETEVKDI